MTSHLSIDNAEIVLKMDWQGYKKVEYFQILHLFDRWNLLKTNNVLKRVNIVLIPLAD